MKPITLKNDKEFRENGCCVVITSLSLIVKDEIDSV